MFKFYDSKGEEVFSSENLSDVEVEARKYKTTHNLLSIEICRGEGKFCKWI